MENDKPVRAPKAVRLLRDGLVWQYGAEWPSPPHHPRLPFRVTDIFADEDSGHHVVFGQPLAKTEEEKLGVCLMACVPMDMGSAIVESLLPRDEAIVEVSRYLALSEEAWACRWVDEDEGDGEAGDAGEAGEARKKAESGSGGGS